MQQVQDKQLATSVQLERTTCTKSKTIAPNVHPAPLLIVKVLIFAYNAPKVTQTPSQMGDPAPPVPRDSTHRTKDPITVQTAYLGPLLMKKEVQCANLVTQVLSHPNPDKTHAPSVHLAHLLLEKGAHFVLNVAQDISQLQVLLPAPPVRPVSSRIRKELSLANLAPLDTTQQCRGLLSVQHVMLGSMETKQGPLTAKHAQLVSSLTPQLHHHVDRAP